MSVTDHPSHRLRTSLLAALGATVATLTAAPLVPVVAQSTSQPAAAATIVRIAAAGDVACKPPFTVGAKTCQQAATARLVTASDPTAVLALGDLQYETGLLADFNSSYDSSWGAFKAQTNPVPGNHEYNSGGSGYYAYFGARSRNAPGYYAYNLGAWRVYALNSNCSDISCPTEVSWLQRDLAANPRRCSLAYMHHPRFSSGQHGNDTSVAPLWSALDAAQADVVLSGHDHSYERFGRLTASGAQSANGIRSFVSGLGGKTIYGFGSVQPGSEFRYNGSHGVLFMSLSDAGYAWQFKTINGAIRDSGSDTCVV